MLIAVSTALPATRGATPAPERSAAAQWMRGMKLRDKIAQLIIAPCFGEDPASESDDYKKFARWVKDVHVGGFIVVNRIVSGQVRNAEPHAMASFFNRMQRLSRVPLLMAGDFERGASMRVANTARFPHLMAYGAAGDVALTRQLGADTARESRALGVHWVFAPDSDVNNNPDNPIINTRSFGENPAKVAEHVRAFIEGAHSDPAARVLVTAKHFPGHGDTGVDSHLNLPVLEASRDRIESTELVPFQAAVAAGVDAVMSAHMAVPALEQEHIPATISSNVLTGVLKKQLKFDGLVVTDAMDMQGLTKLFPVGEAAVRALEAGADVLLMPQDPEAVVNAVEAAVHDGRLSEKRITESVQKILMAKARVGLRTRKLVDIEAITDTTESAAFAEHAQTAADRAVTLLRNEGAAVPLKQGACFWVLAESRYGQGGRRFVEEVRRRARGATVNQLDPLVPQAEVDVLLSKASGCTAHVVAGFAGTGAYRSGSTLPGAYPALLKALGEQQNVPVISVAVGVPYLLRALPAGAARLATFSSAPTAELAAVKALFGEIPTRGRSPVSIPGVASIGDGL